MPDTVIQITPDDALRWLCDEISLQDQRRFLTTLTNNAEVLLASYGYHGRTSLRSVNLFNGLGQILVFPVHLAITAPAALDAAKVGFERGLLRVEAAAWLEGTGQNRQVRKGAVCLVGESTVAAVAAAQKAVEFAILTCRDDLFSPLDRVA